MTDTSTTTTSVMTRRAGVRLGHAAVNTPDLDRFRRFYEDVLGLRLVVVQRPAGAPFRRMGAFADHDGTSVVLLAFETPGYSSGLADDVMGRRGRLDHLAFEARNSDEFDEMVQRLVDAGASSGAVTRLGPGRSVLFVDPDGAHHNLRVEEPGWRPDADVEVVDADLLAGIQGTDL